MTKKYWIAKGCTLGGVGSWARQNAGAPGTWGTLVALPPLTALGFFLPLWLYLATFFGFLIVSVWLCQQYELINGGEHDSSEIVIDEAAGLMVACAALPPHLGWYLAAFLLFRFFDILKPYPISLIDRRVKGGFGVVADDLAAGLFANVILIFIVPKILEAM